MISAIDRAAGLTGLLVAFQPQSGHRRFYSARKSVSNRSRHCSRLFDRMIASIA